MDLKKSIFVIVAILMICSIGFGQGQRIWLATVYPQGFYGLSYNPNNNRVYYLNVRANVISIVSSDSLFTSLGTIPTPNNDTMFTDIKYCAYDNTFWLLNMQLKRVYKINTSGTVLRSFPLSALDYAVGLAWDNDTRTIYIADRRTAGNATPKYIYVFDTLGTQIRRMNHPVSTPWFGPRCLTFAPRSGTRPAMLLNAYTFFNSSQALDSAGVFALNPQNCQVLNYFRVQPVDTCNIRGIEYDPRNNTYWVSLYQYGT